MIDLYHFSICLVSSAHSFCVVMSSLTNRSRCLISLNTIVMATDASHDANTRGSQEPELSRNGVKESKAGFNATQRLSSQLESVDLLLPSWPDPGAGYSWDTQIHSAQMIRHVG